MKIRHTLVIEKLKWKELNGLWMKLYYMGSVWQRNLLLLMYLFTFDTIQTLEYPYLNTKLCFWNITHIKWLLCSAIYIYLHKNVIVYNVCCFCLIFAKSYSLFYLLILSPKLLRLQTVIPHALTPLVQEYKQRPLIHRSKPKKKKKLKLLGTSSSEPRV